MRTIYCLICQETIWILRACEDICPIQLWRISLSLHSERYLRRHSMLEENCSPTLSMTLMNAKSQHLTNGGGVDYGWQVCVPTKQDSRLPCSPLLIAWPRRSTQNIIREYWTGKTVQILVRIVTVPCSRMSRMLRRHTMARSMSWCGHAITSCRQQHLKTTAAALTLLRLRLRTLQSFSLEESLTDYII